MDAFEPTSWFARRRSDPDGASSSGRFEQTLAATAVLTYLVMVSGAALATTGAAAIGLGHQVLAVGGGLGVLGSCLWAIRVRRGAGVVAPLVLASLLYPLQAAISGGPWGLPVDAVVTLHLAVAIGIFASTVVALIWAYSGEHERSRPQRSVADASPDRSTAGPTPPAVVTGDNSAPHATFRDHVMQYVALTKPRLMWLLSLLALAGMALATTSGATLESPRVVATVCGGMLAVGASGTFNHVYERDRDRRMQRTADRPVVTASVRPRNATAFGLGLTAAALAVMWLWTTPVATGLTAVAIAYYAVVYTVLLKPHTTWNIAIGGVAGAIPAVIGWAAMTGGIGLPAVLLAGIVAIWTPAHFYNLAIVYYDDYERGGYPMLPITRGIALTRRRMGYSLVGTLAAASVFAVLVGFGTVFAIASAASGLGFLAAYVHQSAVRTDRSTMATFHASNAYLAVILLGIIVETLWL